MLDQHDGPLRRARARPRRDRPSETPRMRAATRSGFSTRVDSAAAAAKIVLCHLRKKSATAELGTF